MSEFSGEDTEADGEVGFAALRQKISRSEVLTEMPIGYVRTETNRIEKTPDPQVQEAIAEVFLQFRRLGSVGQMLLWGRQEKFRCVVTDAMRGRKCFGPCRVTTHPGDLEEPGLCRCVFLRPDFHPFAYHRRSRAQDSRRQRPGGAMGWNDKLLVQHRVDK
jgi:hypothetical protein